MLSLTRKTDYALVGLTYLAQRGRAQAGPISAREIADRFELPQPLLMNILKELSGAGLLRSTRGANGGYELADDPASITLLRVVSAMEGPVRFAACCSDCSGLAHPEPAAVDAAAEESCPIESNCMIRTPIRRLHHKLTRFLHEVTLADLLEDDADVLSCHASDQPLPVAAGRSI